MAEEKPLFLIDVDRAIEGLLSSAPKNGETLAKIEPLVMHCVDLANALDGAGLEDLSGFANELVEQFKTKRPQAFSLINDLIALAQAEVALIHPSDDAGTQLNPEQLRLAKEGFSAQLFRLKQGESILQESVFAPIEPKVDESEVIAETSQTEVLSSDAQIYPEDFEDKFPNQEFSSDLVSKLNVTASASVVQAQVSSSEPEPEPVLAPQGSQKMEPAQNSNQEPASKEEALNQTLDRTISELKSLFVPRVESPPVVFTPPNPKPFAIPQNVTKPIDRASSLDYASHHRHLDRQFMVDRATNLNRMQKARSLVGKGDGWSGVEVDYLLGREQDDLVRAGQQSLRHLFENLTEELLIDEVYADPDIAQQLLTIMSILPPCPSIFAVQQELMIFIDLDYLDLSNEHLLAVGSMMAEIGGTLEIHTNGARLSCPSSLLRMPMAYFSRHGEHYAVSAIQYLGEEQIDKVPNSKVDSLGEIIHPARRVLIRVGHQEYVIYAHEFLGVQNMNVHQNIPKTLERPYWLAGIALDGANTAYSWVALDRYTR
jgi:hypothetical protein